MLSFIRYLVRGFKWWLLLMLIVGILSIVATLMFIYFSKAVVDIVTDEQEGSAVTYAILMASMLAVSALLRLASIYLTNHTAVRMGNVIRSRIFGHLLYTRWQSLSQLHSGDMLTRIIRDTDDVVTLLTGSIPTALLAALQLLGALIMMYVYSPTLALMLGVGMPLMVGFGRVFYRRMIRFSREVKAIESRISVHMQEALGNQAVIRTFERQEREIEALEMEQRKLYNVVRRRVGLTMYGNLMSSAAFSGGYVVAFLWSAYGLLHGTIQFGTMTTFLQLVARIQRPMVELLGLVPGMISARAAIDRLVHVLEYQTERLDGHGQLTGELTLEVRQMSFAYADGSSNVFDRFDLVAKPGSMVAIMGPTGAGKTTLIRLLLGLLAPTAGVLQLRSALCALPVSEATRRHFVYVPQGNTLYSGSIRDNLLVGDPSADDRKLRHVLRIAAAEFVFDMPGGLDYVLGERGGGLSEGQAQRIAIARSLLRPGRVLLFDEATSALDSETERAILANLRQHINGRIILFITHHDEVARACDQVIRIGGE